MESDEQKRRKRNAEVRAKFLSGQSLSLSDPTDQFFPKRPMIPKDPNALEILFGGETNGQRKRHLALVVCSEDTGVDQPDR